MMEELRCRSGAERRGEGGGGRRGRRGRVEAIEATGQAEVEWRLKKRSATSPRGIARGRPIANGTDGTNARVASLFPPANRVKSPCPPRSSIRGEPRQPAPLTPTDLQPPPPPLLLSTVAPLLFPSRLLT